MAIQHKNITDPDVHEPKGTSTALANQVYVADGAGSGSWTGTEDIFGNGVNVPTGQSLDMQGTSTILTASGDGWKDVTSQIIVRGTGANDPTWELITGSTNMFAYSFAAATMNQFWICFHINHDYALGTKVYPHVHWLNAAASPNTGNVRWGFEYVAAKGHNQAAFPLTATTTVYKTQACPATRYQHMIAEVDLADAIPSTSLEVDSLIYMRIFRDAADGADTCTDKVYVLTADCHYQANTFATKNKAPDFYV